MNFWREILVLEAPFVKELWKLESRQPGNVEDAWTWVMQELSPVWGSGRHFLQKLDERLDHFWDDCLFAEAAAGCRLQARALEDGKWVLVPERKAINRDIQESSLVCLRDHDCPFQPRYHQSH